MFVELLKHQSSSSFTMNPTNYDSLFGPNYDEISSINKKILSVKVIFWLPTYNFYNNNKLIVFTMHCLHWRLKAKVYVDCRYLHYLPQKRRYMGNLGHISLPIKSSYM